MNSSTQNARTRTLTSGAEAAEKTLRLVASLPAPEGIENRVKERLRTAPRSGRMLHWPAMRSGGWMHSTAARCAAAAAIVFVVAGGGWGVYSRVQSASSAKVIVMPQRINAPGGFSSTGAMRTPQTLVGPVLAHPINAVPKQENADVKSFAGPTKKAVPDRKAGKANKSATPPSASPVE